MEPNASNLNNTQEGLQQSMGSVGYMYIFSSPFGSSSSVQKQQLLPAIRASYMQAHKKKLIQDTWSFTMAHGLGHDFPTFYNSPSFGSRPLFLHVSQDSLH